MLNFERWNDELKEVQWALALSNGKISHCGVTKCKDCYFNDGFFSDCSKNRWWWLWEEGEVDYND